MKLNFTGNEKKTTTLKELKIGDLFLFETDTRQVFEEDYSDCPIKMFVGVGIKASYLDLESGSVVCIENADILNAEVFRVYGELHWKFGL